MITFTSTMSITEQNSGDWRDKLGTYIFKRFDGNNAIYEHTTKKGNFLYKNGPSWMVSSFWLFKYLCNCYLGNKISNNDSILFQSIISSETEIIYI